MDAHTYRIAPGILRIDLRAVADNYALLRGEAGSSCTTACVVKADAYGLGARDIVPALIAQGARTFFVATPEEGISLRALVPDIEAPDIEIFILGGLYRGAENDYAAHALTPVLNNEDECARWRRHASDLTRALPCALHIDTGMNRLGFTPHAFDNFSNDPASLAGLDIKLILSHFASADDADSAQTEAQYKIFCDQSAAFPHLPKSLANSSGIFRGKRFHFDMVRPGMALYGLNPTPETDNPMNAAVTLHTKLLQMRPAQKGDAIGYNATHILKDDRMIGTVALGYADGFARAGSDRAQLYFNGTACPVLGRVSMDLVTIDLSGIKGAAPQPGDMIEVIGPHQSADQLAATLGTIGYEVLTNLGKRWSRLYTR